MLMKQMRNAHFIPKFLTQRKFKHESHLNTHSSVNEKQTWGTLLSSNNPSNILIKLCIHQQIISQGMIISQVIETKLYNLMRDFTPHILKQSHYLYPFSLIHCYNHELTCWHRILFIFLSFSNLFFALLLFYSQFFLLLFINHFLLQSYQPTSFSPTLNTTQ